MMMYKIGPIFLFLFLISWSAFSAEKGNIATGSGEELYQKAEKLEWYTHNNMKDVDKLYEEAAKAGSDKASMMKAYTELMLKDPKAKDFEVQAEQLCKEMANIAKKWGESEDADQNFHLARYFSARACKSRNVKKSRELLKKSAESGNAKSQYYMGRMLVKKGSKGAFEWFSKAADQEFPQAIANQGVCYLLGLDVEKNEKKGMELIDRALASGNPNARYDIAIWYLDGEGGLPQDTEKAAQILESLVKSDYQPAFLPLEDIKKMLQKAK